VLMYLIAAMGIRSLAWHGTASSLTSRVAPHGKKRTCGHDPASYSRRGILSGIYGADVEGAATIFRDHEISLC
jgi:hypothetical protein